MLYFLFDKCFFYTQNKKKGEKIKEGTGIAGGN